MSGHGAITMQMSAYDPMRRCLLAELTNRGGINRTNARTRGLDKIAGRRDQLEGKIQERYGIAKDQVKKDIDTWYNTQTW
jgi:hypothetical protein